jgi:hypothetical protein
MSLGRGTARLPRPTFAIRLAVRRYLSREVAGLRRRGAEVVVLQPRPQDLPAMGLNPMQHSRSRTSCAWRPPPPGRAWRRSRRWSSCSARA